jgi:hypothetical protein
MEITFFCTIDQQGSNTTHFVDARSFQSLQDPARLMLMNVILATGAQLSGNMKCANEYFSRARYEGGGFLQLHFHC